MPRRKHIQAYKSGLEDDIAAALKKRGIINCYEILKIEWEDLMYRKYTPDFILPNYIIIESTGRFVAADRRKHLQVKRQHPTLDIRFVFSRSGSKLSKKSKTTYGMWCEKHGFLYADVDIPARWIKEPKGKRKIPGKLITIKHREA